MVHSSNSENHRQPLVPCKAEMDEENVPLGKRLKLVSDNLSQENVLERSGPLGLRLTKSDSLLDLIHRRLSQQNSSSAPSITRGEIHEVVHPEKVKASNFSASLLRIGSWERVSRREGDLVAKFYYAKHKLVWEVLDGSLKSKFEFQSSEIIALKATLGEDGPGTLDIVLERPPLFFKETNPQPRKHTVWKATSDFTGGEASRYRRHFLQCPQGSLDVHFAKLIRHDPHLRALSKHPEIVVNNPYFKQQSSPRHDLKDFYGTNTSEYSNDCFCSSAPSCSSDIRCLDHAFGGDESSDFKSEGPHLTSPVASSRAVETLEDLRSLLMNDFQPTCAADERLLALKMSSLCRLCGGLDDLYGNRSPVDDVGEDGRPGEPQAAEPSLDASPVLMRRLPRASSLPRLLCDDKEVADSDSD